MNRSKFKKMAEEHQEFFKSVILGLHTCGLFWNWKTKETVPFKRYLTDEDAQAGMIFYEGFRDRILASALDKYTFNGRHKSLYVDMLRSEHIPFNIFVPMGLDDYARKETAFVFNKFLKHTRIASVDNIIIEDDRFCDNKDYLDDKTAFDAYIAYTDVNGKRGGIGIEVKYTEASYKIRRKEYKFCTKDDSPYWETTRWSECFTDDPEKMKIKDDFRQIWRNHLLGLAMLKNKQIDVFTHIHLYPKENGHFEEILPIYENKFLTEKGRKTFLALTYEELFSEMEKEFTKENFVQWVQYLKERYLF